MKLTGLSPYRLPGHYAVWRGGLAMVWLWDREIQQELASTEPELPRHYRCLPETVLQRAVATTEQSVTRLQKTRRGIDLQVWKAGALMQSIHYQSPPSPSQIGMLARGIAGLDAQLQLEAESADYLPAPWGGGWQGVQGQWERWVPHGLLTVLLLGCSVQLAQGISWWSESRKLQSEHAQLVDRIEPLLEARTRTQQASAFSAQLHKRMDEQPSQIELLRKVAPLLPVDSRLLSWRLRDHELELQITTDNQDPRYFVQQLQEGGKFQNVRVEPAPAGNGLRLLMSLGEKGAK